MSYSEHPVFYEKIKKISIWDFIWIHMWDVQPDNAPHPKIEISQRVLLVFWKKISEMPISDIFNTKS